MHIQCIAVIIMSHNIIYDIILNKYLICYRHYYIFELYYYSLFIKHTFNKKKANDKLSL